MQIQATEADQVLTDSSKQTAADETAEMFRTIAAAARDAVIVIDEEDRITFWNHAATKMLGYEEAEVLGEKCHQLLTPEALRDTAAAAQEEFRKSGTGNAVGRTLELPALRKDGTEIIVELSLSAIRFDGSWAAAAILRDISNRKKREERYQLMQLSVDEAADAVFWFDSEGKLLYVNQAACLSLGYSRSELRAVDIRKINSYWGSSKWDKFWEDLRQWRTFSLQSTHRTSDGRVFPVEVMVNYLKQDSHEFCCAFARDITERLQAQEALEESEAKYRGLWNSLNEGCVICRLIHDEKGKAIDYQILDVNPAFSRLTGIDMADAVVLTPVQLFNVKSPPYLERFAEVEVSEDPITFEASFPGIDRIFRLSAIQLARGRFAVSFVDLTEQQRIQAALRESEERYEELFGAVQEGILVVDENDVIQYYNPACLQVFETDEPTALKNRNLMDFVPQREREKIKQQTELRIQGKSSTYELEIKTAAGNDKTTLLSVSPHFDDEGVFRGAFAAILDITDRKLIEEELRQSREQLQAILDNVGIGIAVISPQMQVLSLNRQMKAWFPDVDHKSKPLCHRVFNNPPRENVCSYCPTIKTLRDGEIHDAVTRTLAGDETRTYRIVSSPIKSETGDVIAAIEMVEDMTESHRAETVKRDLERRLQETSKLEAVGSLAAGIAHEINTPIQFVGDNTHYLSDCFDTLLKLITQHQELWLRVRQGESVEELDDLWHKAEEEADLEYAIDEVPSAISQTLDGVQRVGQIVRSMKEFAHTDRKETSTCDLNRMLDTTLTVARNELKYVADVVTDYDPDLPEVDCHRDELNQVFLNLLINAAHAIADVVGDGTGGKGTITVKTRNEGDDVIVSISDTGTGIPDAVKDRIFDPFYTTKEVGKGTGQGLYISHSVVVEKHRGSLTLDTKVGKGTTFHVRLPIRQQAASGDEAQAHEQGDDTNSEDPKLGSTA